MKKEILSLRTSMGKRFKTLRSHFNLTQKEMANKLGITFTTISTLELERQLPSLKIILYFINTFRVSPLWLLTGEGEMFINALIVKALELKSTYKSQIEEYEKTKSQALSLKEEGEKVRE